MEIVAKQIFGPHTGNIILFGGFALLTVIVLIVAVGWTRKPPRQR